jgi:hypothetical protein
MGRKSESALFIKGRKILDSYHNQGNLMSDGLRLSVFEN